MSTSDSSREGVRPGLIIGHFFGWLLFALGFAAWCLVFPITLRGYEGWGVGKGLVQLWIGIYGVVAGLGIVTLLGVLGWQRMLAKIVVGVYVALLVAVIVAAIVGAE